MEASITINVGMLLCESDVTALMGEGSGTGLSGLRHETERQVALKSLSMNPPREAYAG